MRLRALGLFLSHRRRWPRSRWIEVIAGGGTGECIGRRRTKVLIAAVQVA
jgi:hypothetical protein